MRVTEGLFFSCDMLNFSTAENEVIVIYKLAVNLAKNGENAVFDLQYTF
jgi:hypothetical protein